VKRLLLALVCAFSLSASGVSISTVTCTSQVVTVNCTTCGVAQYQGFSISGTTVATYNINSTAGTASANTFTFTLPSGTSCNGSASGGTVTPAKQIINTGMIPSVSNATVTIQYVWWLTTATPVIPACAATACTSAYPKSSAAEIAAIAAGTTVESVGQMNCGSSTAALTACGTQLIANYQAAQAYQQVNNAYVGYWYNGSAWVNQ